MRASAQESGLTGSLSKKCWSSVRNVPVTPTPSISPAVQMGGVLQYKWEAYCRVPFLRSLKARKYGDTNGGRTAVQIGGVLPYFLDKL